MKVLSWLDKALLILGFLIVVSIFTLAYVMYAKGGLCVYDPIQYALNNNITISPNFQVYP